MPLFGKKKRDADEESTLDVDDSSGPNAAPAEVPANEEEAVLNQHFEEDGAPKPDGEDPASALDGLLGETGAGKDGGAASGEGAATGDDVLNDDLMAIFDSEVVEDESLKALTSDLEDLDLNALLTQARHLSSRMGSGGAAP